jgi:hypothetical protein
MRLATALIISVGALYLYGQVSDPSQVRIGTADPAADKVTGPAPSGEPIVVAQRMIRDSFERSACPSVSTAQRSLDDGSIRARCSNGEIWNRMLTGGSL